MQADAMPSTVPATPNRAKGSFQMNTRIGHRPLVVGSIPAFNWMAIRSLNAAGCRPFLIGHSRLSAHGLPPFCRGFARYEPESCRPIPADALGALGPEFVRYIARKARDFGAVVLIPTCLTSILSCLENPDALEGLRLYVLPTADQIRTLNNKWHFSTLLRDADLPRPETVLLERVEDIDKIDFDPPYIVKPTCRAFAAGVVRCSDKAAIARHMQSGALFSQPPLVAQKFLTGPEFCACFLAVDGEVRATANFRDEKPFRAFIESPDIEQLVAAIVRATHYRGLGIIDMIKDERDGRFKPLEMNPRFWGSMLGSLDVGVNFVQLGLEATFGEPFTGARRPLIINQRRRVPITQRIMVHLSKPAHHY